jgi:hypothetical protein
MTEPDTITLNVSELSEDEKAEVISVIEAREGRRAVMHPDGDSILVYQLKRVEGIESD